MYNSNAINNEYRNIQQQRQLTQETRFNKTMFKRLHCVHQGYIRFCQGLYILGKSVYKCSGLSLTISFDTGFRFLGFEEEISWAFGETYLFFFFGGGRNVDVNE